MSHERRRTVVFIAWTLGVALVNATALRALYSMSWGNPTASHIMVIPLVSCALLIASRRAIASSARWDVPVGLGVIVIGLGLLLASRPGLETGVLASALTYTVGALVMMWLGGFLLCFGRRSARAVLFPLLFLAFMIPAPPALLDAATQFLKSGSADTVAALFTVTGTPQFREEDVFFLSGAVVEVGDECSGIRSSIGLVLTAFLAGYALLDRPSHKAILVAAAIPMAVLKNAIRIVTLSLLAMHVDPGFLTGRLHHEGGVVFFALALAFMAPLLILLRRREMVSTSAPLRDRSSGGPALDRAGRA